MAAKAEAAASRALPPRLAVSAGRSGSDTADTGSDQPAQAGTQAPASTSLVRACC